MTQCLNHKTLPGSNYSPQCHRQAVEGDVIILSRRQVMIRLTGTPRHGTRLPPAGGTVPGGPSSRCRVNRAMNKATRGCPIPPYLGRLGLVDAAGRGRGARYWLRRDSE